MCVVMEKLYLLILSARHLLEKVWYTLAFWDVKAEALGRNAGTQHEAHGRGCDLQGHIECQ